jgi:hypothetical protein
VAHACDPSNSGGRDWEDGKKLQDVIPTKQFTCGISAMWKEGIGRRNEV